MRPSLGDGRNALNSEKGSAAACAALRWHRRGSAAGAIALHCGSNRRLWRTIACEARASCVGMPALRCMLTGTASHPALKSPGPWAHTHRFSGHAPMDMEEAKAPRPGTHVLRCRPSTLAADRLPTAPPACPRSPPVLPRADPPPATPPAAAAPPRPRRQLHVPNRVYQPQAPPHPHHVDANGACL